jgi:hypothetical protein
VLSRGDHLPQKVGIKNEAGKQPAFSICRVISNFWPCSLFHYQVDSLCPNNSCLDRQFSDADGLVEASRTGASWVKKENSIFFFNFWLMAVAVHDSPKACRLWLQIKLAQVMQHIDRYAINFNDLRLRKAAGPRLSINVTANSRDGSDLGKITPIVVTRSVTLRGF